MRKSVYDKRQPSLFGSEPMSYRYLTSMEFRFNPCNPRPDWVEFRNINTQSKWEEFRTALDGIGVEPINYGLHPRTSRFIVNFKNEQDAVAAKLVFLDMSGL